MIFQAVTAGLYCTMYVLLFGAISQAGLVAFDFLFRKQRRPKGNETAGLMFGAISLIYSLILAFVIVAVWTDYEDLTETIGKETYKLNEVMTHSSTLPDSIRHPLDKALKDYCTNVVTQEWELGEGEVSSFPVTITRMRMLLMHIQPGDKLQESVAAVILEDLNRISDLRRERLEHIRSHVPQVVWLILKAGSLILIVFSYFLEVPWIHMKRVYLFFLSSIMGMSLFLVDVLNDPFQGSVAVSKRPYEITLEKLQQPSFLPKN
ncbi:MAG: DUF4239 domain-containing protein [Williamsia sp.]|nr:DUF4239 domain-containing protein [Williamsia sp.]